MNNPVWRHGDGAFRFPAKKAVDDKELTTLVEDFLRTPAPPESGGGGATGAAALNAWLPAVYDELRRLAAAFLRDERMGHTLQPTALVHEAYLRLLDQRQVDWQNRGQFLGVAARVMRRVLAKHAIARAAEKRNPSGAPPLLAAGGSSSALALDNALDFYDRREISLAAVDEALTQLEALDPRQARIVELRFYGGMTIEEAAAALDISPATVKREWSTAKRWLHRAISARP